MKIKKYQNFYKKMAFQIRNYKNEDEYKMIQDWANKQGWNQGIYDYLAFKCLDKGGFWLGVLDGQPIANLSVAQYDQNFAFFGLYIVKKQHRGKGYGFQVWKHALSKLTSKNISLDGVLAQQHNYQKSGFKTFHKTIRYTAKGNNDNYKSQYLTVCKETDFQKLSKYDRQNFPAQRKQFLKKWISLPESKAIVFVKQDKIYGYGVLRRSYQGYRLGPLFADSYQVAFQIISSFLGGFSEESKLSIDVPDINSEAIKLVTEFKLIPQFQCVRMYTNGMPEIPFHKTVYGVTSLEFG